MGGNALNTHIKIAKMIVRVAHTIRVCGFHYSGKRILTLGHCGAEKGSNVTITFSQGDTQTYEVTDIVRYEDHDQCVLYIKDIPMAPNNTHLFTGAIHSKITDALIIKKEDKQTYIHHQPVTHYAEKNYGNDGSSYPSLYITQNMGLDYGDCGTPLISMKSGLIVGMYIGTYKKEYDAFVPINTNFLQHDTYKQDTIATQFIEQQGFACMELNQRHPLYNFVCRKTALVKSPLHGIFEVKKWPAVLSKRHELGDPLMNSFVKGFRPSTPVPSVVIDIATDVVGAGVATLPHVLDNDILSDEEVLNGVPGKLKGVDMATSLGLPGKKMTLRIVTGKQIGRAHV